MSDANASAPASAAASAAGAPSSAPDARSREQAKQWKKERKLQAQKKKEQPPAPTEVSLSKPKRPPRDASPEVQLSKALSYLLRHGAEKEFLSIRPDGFIRVDALLARPKVQKIEMPDGAETRPPTLADIQAITASSDKQRFELSGGTADAPGAGDVYWMRAVQGHSLSSVTQLEHVDLTPANVHEHLAERGGKYYAIHGTNNMAWDLILASQALKPMGRNHIHLAKGLPGASGVISGMRTSCTRHIYVDVSKALRDGVPFSVSSNGVVLTPGVDGALPLAYVDCVEDAHSVQIWP